MGTQGSSAKGIRKLLELNRVTIGLLVFLTLLIIMVLAFVFQMVAEQDAFTLNPGINPSNTKEQYEIAKLAAEIREIRSDTSGSLFWLKMIALFVTVGGAVGGYLIGQSKTTRNRIEAEERLNRERSDFEHNKNVDAVYHSYLQELSLDFCRFAPTNTPTYDAVSLVVDNGRVVCQRLLPSLRWSRNWSSSSLTAFQMNPRAAILPST